jgi:putative ABC transport system permease protein
VEAVKALPGVAAVDGTRVFPALIGEETIRVSARDVQVAAKYDPLAFLDGGSALPRLAGRLSAVVSEPLARKFRLSKGDFFTLKTPVGSVPLEILGVYKDYADEQGTLLMDRGTYLSLYRDPSVNRLGLYLEPGHPREEVRRGVLAAGGDAGNLRVLSHADLRRDALGAFTRTNVLALLMVLIAMAAATMGTLTALTFRLLDRASEIGILRYLGATRSQVRGVVLWEACLLACWGCALGCLVGWVLSRVWVGVLGAQIFGWTIRYAPPWSFLGASLVVVGLSALLGGYFPARAAANLPPLRTMNRE